MRKTKKDKGGLFSLGLAFIFLINPNVNIFDILPDFIAYYIIAEKLKYAAPRAPFFSEARDAARKLALVTLIKIPASLLMTSFRSQNFDDNDIRALFVLTFGVFEAVILFSLIKNLFAGFSYLGQRSDNIALISPFYVNKKETKKMTPEGLSLLTYAFVFYKILMSVLPETFLLTKIITTGEAVRYFNIARLYPYTVVFGIVTVLALGIVWKKRFGGYLAAIKLHGGFREALDSMLDDGRRAELELRRKLDGMKFALTLLAVSTVLTVDLKFDNLKGINLLPPFIFAFVIMFAGIGISRYSKKSRSLIIFGSLFTVCTFLRYLCEFFFLEKYGYEVIAVDYMAKRSYIPLIAAFVLETVFFTIFILSFSSVFKSFVLSNTGLEPSCERYSVQDKEYHGVLKRKVYIFAGLSIILWLSKLTECILKFFSKNTYVSWEVDGGDLSVIRPETGLVSESPAPWFGVAVLIIAVFYIAYTFFLASELKEEAELKYIDN